LGWPGLRSRLHTGWSIRLTLPYGRNRLPM
jgi:hypothetical protein